MVKGFRQIAIFTVLSRVLGFVRDMAFAYFLGAGALFDGWAIAFKIPNLARRIFGEGAAAASFIPVYSEELHHRGESANKLACTVVTVVFVLLAVLVLIGEGIIWGYYAFFSELPGTDLKLQLTAIMLPYMIVICVVAILAGILQTHRHFAMPAAAPMVLNIFIIGSLCFTGWVMSLAPNKQVFAVACAVIVAGFTQLGMQLVPLFGRGIMIRPAWQVRSEAFKKILLLMGPMILGMTVTQINTLADDLIALWLSGSAEKGEQFSAFGNVINYPLWEGTVSHLYYSQRLYQFPLGVLGISLATAIFPVMSADAAKKDDDALVKTISKGLAACVFIALPATAGLILVRSLLVKVAFERGEFTAAATAETSAILLFYSIGLCGYFLQQIVIRSFYALQDSKMPARTAAIAVAVNVILNLTLVWFMGACGLALATALCSYLQIAILWAVLQKRFNTTFHRDLTATLLKSAVATVVMYIAGLGVVALLKGLADSTLFNVIRLMAIVITCSAVYTAASVVLRIRSLSLLTGKYR